MPTDLERLEKTATPYKVVKTQSFKSLYGGNGKGLVSAVLSKLNPEVANKQKVWADSKVIIEQNQSKYTGFMLALPNEKASTRNKRAKHFVRGFVNPAPRLLATVSEYIYRKPVTRDTEGKYLTAFINKADGAQSLSDFMRNHAVSNLRGYGNIFIVIDKPVINAHSLAEELKNGMPYATMLDPMQVLDYRFTGNSLDWFRYSVDATPARGPFEKQAEAQVEYVTWTRMDYSRHDKDGVLISGFSHNLGIVPVVVRGAFVPNSRTRLGDTTFDTTVNYIIMGNNLSNIGNNEIFKFGSAILIATEQAFSDLYEENGRDPDSNQPRMTKDTAEVSDVMTVSTMAEKPEYLTKDITVVDVSQIRAERYFTAAIDNEALSRVEQKVQSGDAKRYDREEQEAMLAGTAADLEGTEEDMLRIVAAWTKDTAEYSVKYDRNFDVRSFNDAINELKMMMGINYPSDTAKKELMKRMAAKITNNEKVQAIIIDEIDRAVLVVDEPDKPGQKEDVNV